MGAIFGVWGSVSDDELRSMARERPDLRQGVCLASYDQCTIVSAIRSCHGPADAIVSTSRL
jgi:hypothetical protein